MNILELPDASLCVRLAATMGHFLWQGAAVYLLVILAGLVLRWSSAGARYAVFTAALLVMAVCPPVTFVLLRSPEGPATTVGGQSPPYVRSEVETPSAFLGEQSPPYLIGGQNPPHELDAVSPLVEPVSLAVPDEPGVQAIDWWRYAPWLVACYLGGTTLMFARLLVALCGGQRLRRRSEPVDDPAILAAFARQTRALGLRFTPAIAFCREVAVPTVVGVLRPMILLPLSAVSGLTTEQIEVLLTHELAHIRRYDHLVNVLQRLIEAVLFFHPAVWFVSRRIRIEREHCCDDLVLAIGGKRLAYAESLVRMAELSRGGQSLPYGATVAALGAADRPSQLRLRILRLVSGSTGEQVRLLRPAVLGLCLFLMLAAVACVQLASRPTEDRPIEAVPPGMVGTWFFENPMGDDEQMAVFADGRIVVLYSNGHRGETRYTDGAIELAEYGNLKAKLTLLPDGTLQTSTERSGIAKLWQRIDAVPKTEMLRPLTEPPAEPPAAQPVADPAAKQPVPAGEVGGRSGDLPSETETPGVPGDEPLDVGTLELGGPSAPITAKPRRPHGATSTPAAPARAVTVSIGQSEPPQGGSLAWYLLRQRAVAPLLTELPIRLAGTQEASVLESPVWKGHPGGISVELDVRFEGKFTEDDGDLVIGFFSDPKWSQMPERAAKIAGAGRHTITGVPPGKYQIGAMIGDLADPAAVGVHKSWPQPVEVVAGKPEPVELLLSAEFNYSLGTYYKSVVKSLLPGHTVQHPDRLVEGRVTDATGKPVRHVIVSVGETAGKPAPGKNAAVVRYAQVGTNEEGRYFCDEVAGAYTLGVNLTQSLPELFGCRWQSISNLYRVYRGPKTADFVLDPVPSGTAALAGEVYDQDGKPLKEFVLDLRTLPEYAQPPEILKRKLKSALRPDGSDDDESDHSERLVGYRLTCLSADGRFSFNDLPPGWYRVSPMAFDFELYEYVPSQDIALANGETTTLKFVVKHKRVFHGRVLLSDGSVPPAAVRPPYKDARILLSLREEGRSMSSDQVGFVEPDGHVRVLLTAAQHRALIRNRGFIGIDYPMIFRRDLRESYGWRHVGVYPLDQLSPDRDKAGEVRLRYPEPPDAEPVGTQPASVGEVGGRSGDLPYGTGALSQPRPDDIADVPVLDLNAGGNEKMRYFLIGPRPDERVPAAGYKLLVVLPGGDGGADFNPFVCRIFKNALPAGYIVAQPVAFKWVLDQQIVWPTRIDRVMGQQFATEDFVEAVIKDVRSKHMVDDRCVFTLSWSSGGPAAYAVSLAENSPVTGSFVAMSVFKPDRLPSLDRAQGHAYYIYHSPDDRVCSYRMAQQAENMLKEKAAAVTLKTYPGGHGWKGGDIFGAIRTGVDWLEKHAPDK